MSQSISSQFSYGANISKLNMIENKQITRN